MKGIVLLLVLASFIAVSHARVHHARPGVRVHQTSAASEHHLARLADLPVHPRGHRAAAVAVAPLQDGNYTSVLTVNTSDLKQEIMGFGGAITEASVTVLAGMPADKVAEVIEAFYGETGNQYSIARLHINSCDFSVNSWNFDPVEDDFDLVHFDTNVTHEHQYLLPFLHTVLDQSAHPLRIFASPWSPPAWMKANGVMDGSDHPGLKNDTRYHAAWANYLALWFTAFKAQEIPLWGMTVQNEPENPAKWEACVYTPEQERDFIRDYLGPVMREQHPDINIMAYDHNKDNVLTWANTIYADPEAAQYLWGIAVHWYSGDEFDHLNETHEAWPEYGLLATEATNGPGVIYDDVTRAEAYAHDMIGDLNNWVEGWIDWNIVLDPQGGPNHVENWCDAAVIADPKTGELVYQWMYFYMGHFSRFLPPGGRTTRITFNLNSNDPAVAGLEFAAFLVEPESTEPLTHPRFARHANRRAAADATNEIVLVVLNQQDVDAEFTLAFEDQEVQVRIPQHTIQTLVYAL